MVDAGEYDGIQDAVQKIQAKAEYRGPDELFHETPSPETIVEWTEALTGFEAGTTVTPAEDHHLRNIRSFYGRSEALLETRAAELGVASLNEFSPNAVLFMVGIRELQSQHAGKPNLNPHKLSVLQGGRYAVE